MIRYIRCICQLMILKLTGLFLASSFKSQRPAIYKQMDFMKHFISQTFYYQNVIRYVYTITYLLTFVIERFYNYSFISIIESYCRKQFCPIYTQIIVGCQIVCDRRHALRVFQTDCW